MRLRRRVPRYISELNTAVSQPPGSASLKVTTTNLSVLGCCVEGVGPLKPDQICEVTIEWQGQRFRADAEIKWKSSKGEAGLNFLDLDQLNQTLLRKICSNLKLQPMATLPPEI
jgi:hypothetical protein